MLFECRKVQAASLTRFWYVIVDAETNETESTNIDLLFPEIAFGERGHSEFRGLCFTCVSLPQLYT